MATVIGHWASLAEAQKLTQSVLLSGVVDVIIEQGLLLPMMPVKQLNGNSLKYNREVSTEAEDGASFVDIGEQIPWTSDVAYDAIEVELHRIVRQDALDKFLRATYNNVNDYRAVMIAKLAKRITRFTEHHIIYGDQTNGGAKQYDGLHRMNQEGATAVAVASAVDGDTNIDMGQAVLSLATLRLLLDTCKVEQLGRDNVIILMPRVIARRFDAAYQEAGFVRSSVTVSMGSLEIGAKQIGGRLMSFDGVPILRTDRLVAEQAGVGESGSDLRAKWTSGDKQYSVFVVRFGSIENGGLEMLFGDVGMSEGEFSPFRHETFDKLENYDAGGERIVGYLAPALGANHSLGRIFDIEDGALTP